MQNVPDVKYARSGGVAVAYQVIGEGPRDLMFVTFLSNLVSLWQFSPMRRFFEQLAAETWLMVVNPRGMGLSDRPRSVTLEGWMDDIRAVLDAERIERASLLGTVDSANACLLLATTYPEQVERLVLFTPIARFVRSDEYPIGVSEEDGQATIRSRREHWGDRDYLLELAPRLNPQWADDEEYLDWFVLNARLAASPTAAAEFWRMQLNTDITDVLSSVRVPTLVLHRAAARDAAEFVAQRIAGAIVIEIPGVGLTSPMMRSSMPPSRSFVGSRRGSSRTPCSPRCCSPTSLAPPRPPQRSATARGERCSSGTMPLFDAKSPASAAPWSTPQATDSSAASMGRPARSPARARSWQPRRS